MPLSNMVSYVLDALCQKPQQHTTRQATKPRLIQAGDKVMQKEIKWEQPEYCELRLGFEVTAYAYTR